MAANRNTPERTSRRNDGILWLASYPKSGNTWFRALLDNAISHQDTPVSINALTVRRGITRAQVDALAGVDSSLLLPAELDTLWPDIHRGFAHTLPAPRVVKTHSALQPHPAAGFLAPDLSAGALYLVRNPLDVCVSFSHHLGRSLDETVAIMANEDFCLHRAGPNWRPSMTERLASWSTHVKSWVDNRQLPTLVLRYEDLLDDTEGTFSRALTFLGLDIPPEKMARAIAFSSFESLQRQEQNSGFREKSSRSHNFFRQGKKEGWRDRLSRTQINALQHAHGELMEELGYSAADSRAQESAELV